MVLEKSLINKYTNILILVFLSIHVIGSQLSVALSSIGLSGFIILIIFSAIMNRGLQYKDSRLLSLFLLLVLSFLISGIFSSEPTESFDNSRRIFLFAAFFATFIFIRNLKQLKAILTCLFLVTAVVSVIEIVRYLIDIRTLTDLPVTEFRIRYFGYPITIGEIKMLVLLLIFPFIITREDFLFNKWLLIFIAAIVLLSLYFTNTRNAMLGLTAGLIYLGFAKNKIFLAGMVVFIVCFLVFAPNSAKERILSIADLNHPSNRDRFTMWETGFKIFKDYPATGIGDIDVAKVYERYKPIEHYGEGVHMHNNFMHILISFGLIGIIIWSTLMIYIFVRQIKIYYLTRKDKILNNLAAASIASMIAFQVSGLTEWNFGDFEVAAVLWFSLGLAFLSEKLYKEQAAAN